MPHHCEKSFVRYIRVSDENCLLHPVCTSRWRSIADDSQEFNTSTGRLRCRCDCDGLGHQVWTCCDSLVVVGCCGYSMNYSTTERCMRLMQATTCSIFQQYNDCTSTSRLCRETQVCQRIDMACQPISYCTGTSEARCKRIHTKCCKTRLDSVFFVDHLAVRKLQYKPWFTSLGCSEHAAAAAACWDVDSSTRQHGGWWCDWCVMNKDQTRDLTKDVHLASSCSHATQQLAIFEIYPPIWWKLELPLD